MLTRLERLWRQVGTGVSFILFGLGGVVLTLTVFPAINLFFRDPRRAHVAQRVVHFVWKAFVSIMVYLRVIDFDVAGADLLRSETGTLVIANHPSLIDVVLIMSLMRRTQCVVKPGVYKNPFMRGVVKATNYIPNIGDPETLIADCVSALRAGNNLVIFPEGSRTPLDQPRPRLQRGFANIAVRAQAPVRLVQVTVHPRTLTKGEKWYQSPLSRPRFSVRVCERVDMRKFQNTDVPSLAARNLTAYVTKRFEEMAANGGH